MEAAAADPEWRWMARVSLLAQAEADRRNGRDADGQGK
jgi:hypothetical protein